MASRQIVSAGSPVSFMRNSASATRSSARCSRAVLQRWSWRRQLQRWNEGRLRRALDAVAEAEFRMKLTGLPAETICREAMFALAREARAGRG